MAYTLIVAEKPSVGRDIARVLKCTERADGYIIGAEYRVTWAVGHLVTLSDPEEINPEWKRWREADLPMLPENIPLKVLPKTKSQFNIIKKLMRDKECTGIICATDAGREGELIYRYIALMAGCNKPSQRLWISSMTDSAIKEGFANIRPLSQYDALYDSARCRSEADWLVGMNASRAFTLRYGALLSIGRVQTPTLALLVRRRKEIEAFVSTPYWTIAADFGGYTGLWLNEETREKRVLEEALAAAIAARVKGGTGTVESIQREAKRETPPPLYDLTSLQRDANRLLGFTAQKTLSTAQKLYEEHKLITYPRTDSRYLPRDMIGRTRKTLQNLPMPYSAMAAPLLAEEKLPMKPSIFNDAKVTDHHAILPTEKTANLDKLPPDAKALYDLIARRLLGVFYPDYLYDQVRVLTRVGIDPFESLGREVRQEGWKTVQPQRPTKGKEKEKDDEAQALPTLSEGEQRPVKAVTVKAEKTKPPAPHTDASLLYQMENAGREIEDEALREAMKAGGLGTPATRAAIIERLITVGYAERKGRAIQATDKGVKLIAVAPQDIASPETTGRWEKALSDIAQGQMAPDRFLSGIRRLSAVLVEGAKAAPSDIVFEKEERKSPRRGTAKTSAGVGVKCPLCGKGDVLENSKAFYCSRFREDCKLTIWKDAVQRQGGPELTPALVKRLFLEKKLYGSTGLLSLDGATVRFNPGEKPVAKS